MGVYHFKRGIETSLLFRSLYTPHFLKIIIQRNTSVYIEHRMRWCYNFCCSHRIWLSKTQEVKDKFLHFLIFFLIYPAVFFLMFSASCYHFLHVWRASFSHSLKEVRSAKNDSLSFRYFFRMSLFPLHS